MGKVVDFDRLRKGEDLIFITASGIIAGKYAGIEYIRDEPWIHITDGFAGPIAQHMDPAETLALPETFLQFSQVIAMSIGTAT